MATNVCLQEIASHASRHQGGQTVSVLFRDIGLSYVAIVYTYHHKASNPHVHNHGRASYVMCCVHALSSLGMKSSYPLKTYTTFLTITV